ncbi:hypothetical protein ACIQF6_00600 [Kitasatospora sp. NPDC092948]|uniref:hypothetical protein n=1 Tax=Kitasatospora sp. NPDC092948 TaxID=3364088 RepID=UPI0038175771
MTPVKKLLRTAVVAACAASAALAVVPVAHAASQGQGCRYYYTSWFKGPNGQTDGYGDYPEGATDPEGRVCQNGWWVDQDADY